jgi:hypothetical protein
MKAQINFMIMNKIELACNAQVNLMYFFWNFSQQDVRDVFEYIGMSDHLWSKFVGHDNGTDALIHVFFELSRSSQLMFTEWVLHNYSGNIKLEVS